MSRKIKCTVRKRNKMTEQHKLNQLNWLPYMLNVSLAACSPIGPFPLVTSFHWPNDLPITAVCTTCGSWTEGSPVSVTTRVVCGFTGWGFQHGAETLVITTDPESDQNHETRHGGLLRVRSGASGSWPARAADWLRGEQLQYDLYVWIPGVSGE